MNKIFSIVTIPLLFLTLLYGDGETASNQSVSVAEDNSTTITAVSDTTIEATYTRDPSNGNITTSIQDWDGNFWTSWTDNPAWIYYDLLTNKRYGLGNYIDGDDVDKWELFSIAKYCDELVPTPYGGTEPRFTANLYLTKAAAAYKVLKDMATIFRGILYWIIKYILK